MASDYSFSPLSPEGYAPRNKGANTGTSLDAMWCPACTKHRFVDLAEVLRTNAWPECATTGCAEFGQVMVQMDPEREDAIRAKSRALTIEKNGG